MQNRELKNFCRRYSLLLVIILAARAMIPVGYMLSFPANGQAGFALHLCPGQNPHLNLDALDDTDIEHHHHHLDAAGSTGDNEALSVSAECRAWVTSSIFAAHFTDTSPQSSGWMAIRPLWSNDVTSARSLLLSAYPRAPPQRLSA